MENPYESPKAMEERKPAAKPSKQPKPHRWLFGTGRALLLIALLCAFGAAGEWNTGPRESFMFYGWVKAAVLFGAFGSLAILIDMGMTKR